MCLPHSLRMVSQDIQHLRLSPDWANDLHDIEIWLHRGMCISNARRDSRKSRRGVRRCAFEIWQYNLFTSFCSSRLLSSWSSLSRFCCSDVCSNSFATTSASASPDNSPAVVNNPMRTILQIPQLNKNSSFHWVLKIPAELDIYNIN